MLRSTKELQGYKILATDGQIGKVGDFFFDDLAWTIRYLVADTGSWLIEKEVLISPTALVQPDWSHRIFPVNLSQKQIENSPEIDADRPVSRQHEVRLNKYYNWPLYWTEPGSPVAPPPFGAGEEEAVDVEEDEQAGDQDLHLRSTKEVMKYRIRAIDGEIGHLEDFILDDEIWTIRYLVIDTRNWLPGKKVLVAPGWIKRIDWAGAQVHVELVQESIEKSPEYDPSSPVNREYEERLYDFYGRPKYWQ